MEVKVVMGSVPKDGGTFTFYRNIRPELLKSNIDLRCVSVGKIEADLWEDAYADEGCVLLVPGTRNLKKQSKAFVDWCEEEAIDIVIGVNSEAILSAIPHLPERIRVVSRCANAFDHGYRITMSGRERLAAIVATTPRLEVDLTHSYGADPSIMHLIPNGIDPLRFDFEPLQRGTSEKIQLGFLGRLEHNQKGVFHLPGIVQELNRLGVDFELRIAGKGKHEKELAKRLKSEVANGQVLFLGALGPDEVPEFLAKTDVFVFTSHFEGCPNALLEAMMAGCVPVSWIIEGITDYLINNGITGLLAPIGNCKAFARLVKGLAVDRELLNNLSENTSLEARRRFSNRVTAESYARLIHLIMSVAPPGWNSRPWSVFEGDPNFDHTWKDRIPYTLRKKLKVWNAHYFNNSN